MMDENTVMGFVRLFVICVFVYVHLSLWKRQELTSDKVWRAANQTLEQNMWKVHWLTQAMAFERFCSYHYLDFFKISFFVHINTLIFSVYLVHYPSFLYIYWGAIKRKCTKKRIKKFWFFAYSLYIGMVYNAEVSQNSSKLRIEKCFQVF